MQTKQEVLALVDGLVNKSLTFGCLVQNNWAKQNQPYIFLRKSGSDLVCWCAEFNKEFVATKRRHDEDREPLTILGHDLLLGDIFIKLSGRCSYQTYNANCTKLTGLWASCGERYPHGLSKSVQEIISASGWEKCCNGEDVCCGGEYPPQERLKDPNARALLAFIGELKLK